MRLDILQGTSADDGMVAARWAEALRFLEMAAENGFTDSQVRCGLIYATGGRSVPQNWATAVKWWRKAAEAGNVYTNAGAQWNVGLCFYYGLGVDRDVAQAKLWFGKAAAQGYSSAVHAVQDGSPGLGYREMIVDFTNAGPAAPRHAVAHEFTCLSFSSCEKWSCFRPLSQTRQ
jgi:TPR repeat protein